MDSWHIFAINFEGRDLRLHGASQFYKVCGTSTSKTAGAIKTQRAGGRFGKVILSLGKAGEREMRGYLRVLYTYVSMDQPTFVSTLGAYYM